MELKLCKYSENFLKQFKNIFLLIVLFSMSIINAKEFGDYFHLVRLIRINPNPEQLGQLSRICVDKDGYFIGFDYMTKQVLLFNPEGNFERIIARTGKGPGEVMIPFSGGLTSDNTLIVIDWALRRISFFKNHQTFIRSFIFSSKHTQPSKVHKLGNYYYFTASHQEVDHLGYYRLVMKYGQKGEFVKSFYDTDASVAGTLFASENSAKIVIVDPYIYAIQSAVFKIVVLDTSGNIIKTFGSPPAYFQPPPESAPTIKELNEMSYKHRRKAYDTFRNTYTPLIYMIHADDKLFVSTLIERGGLPERKEMMEVYGLDGTHLDGNIKLDHMLYLTTGLDGYFYFLLEREFAEDNTYYTIGKFSYIGADHEK